MTYQKMIVFPLFLSFFRALTALASLKKILPFGLERVQTVVAG